VVVFWTQVSAGLCSSLPVSLIDVLVLPVNMYFTTGGTSTKSTEESSYSTYADHSLNNRVSVHDAFKGTGDWFCVRSKIIWP